MMRINWPWIFAAITIAATCMAVVWLPFLLSSSSGQTFVIR